MEAGKRRIIFEQVTPPSRQPATSTAAAASTLPPETTSVIKPLRLSCTVHQQEMTEVRWMTAEGEHVIWSSINFHDLTPLTEFEQDGVSWQIHFGLGDEADTSPQLTAFRNIPKPAENHSWYQIVQSPANSGASAAFGGMDALHRYFDAHRDALAAKKAEIDHANALRQQAQAAAATSPSRPETLIRFWPLKSRRYGVTDGTSTGGNQAQ